MTVWLKTLKNLSAKKHYFRAGLTFDKQRIKLE